MIQRREYKYLVPVGMLDDLRRHFKPLLVHDSFAACRPKKEYTIRSIYYDTLNFDYYYEKIDGYKVRKKLRIRGYNEPDENSTVFLEIKRKYNNFISKNRAQLYYRHLEDLMCSGDVESYVFNKEKFPISDAYRFFYHIHKHYLKPTSLITYDREAYFYKFDENIRITFDKNLRYKSFPYFYDVYDESILKPAMPKYFVLEIKFYSGFSPTLQEVTKKFGLTRLAVSKYQICLDADKIIKPTQTKRFAFNIPIWNDIDYKKEVI